jgi:glycosyltransferase involved in cell wall biosynthesis
MQDSITIVIPAYNAERHLRQCLEALRQSADRDFETIVVDDGSQDRTRDIAAQYGAKVLASEARCGPASARNLGAKQASGTILFFIDSDVCVRPGSISKVKARFNSDPELDALIGSYDTEPKSQDFLSQYRNLMHCYVHQHGSEQACTFWSGCGAIRKEVFIEQSGFSEDYARPAIEDIELGYRLVRAGRKIVLDRSLLVTHLKRWTFWGLVKTDIMDRGIPWTELILRDRFMPNDLNVMLSQRISVALVFLLVFLTGAMAILHGFYILIPPLAIVFLMLGRWWSEMGVEKRPPAVLLALNAMLLLIAVLAYTNRMFWLMVPLLLSPGLLFIRHRYATVGSIRTLVRLIGILYMLASLAAAAYYLPAHHLIFAIFLVLALVGAMNSNFYVFLAGKRGLAFMLAAIPFHLLYHFYNGISFIIGSARHYWNAELKKGDLPAAASKSNTSAPELKQTVAAEPHASVEFKLQ